jgi:hypothetical protein
VDAGARRAAATLAFAAAFAVTFAGSRGGT